MKKLMTIAAGLLVASSAFASTVTTHQDTTFFSDSYQTKADAYNAGFDISESLQAMSKSQLRNELPVFAGNAVRDIAVDDSKVTVQEFAMVNGGVQYKAVVNVDYHYKVQDND